MFGSKDKPQNPDAKTSAKPEKKGLFGWARRREEPAPSMSTGPEHGARQL